jgi:hypothetical protein
MDKLYESARTTCNIQVDNEEYRHYEKLIPLDFTTKNEFLCLKVKKTKILFCQSNVKVYLSDADIIRTIVKFDDNTVNFFLEKFSELYNGNGQIFRYRVNSRDFDGRGLEYVKNKSSFLLHCDMEININDFIFILNMIFEKDRLFTRVAGKNLLKVTLCKFIVLIKYYKFNDKICCDFLQEIGYSVDKQLYSVFNSPANTEKTSSLFENLSQFEKSGIL